MQRFTTKTAFLVTISIILALIMAVVTIPKCLYWIWPHWVPLVLIYWILAVPDRLNIKFAVIVGLILDVATGSLLGLHILALVIVAYLTTKFHRRIKMFNLGQQMLAIFGMIFIYQTLLFWPRIMLVNAPHVWIYWLSSISSTLLWPVIHKVLERIRASGTYAH